MAIDGVGNRTSFLTKYLIDTRSQLEDLQQQLATGKRSNTYAGSGVNRGFAIGLRAQIEAISSYGDSITNVNARINVASAALSRMDDLGKDTKSAALKNSVALDADGQTSAQKIAMSSVAEMLQLLNTQAGDRHLFSGRATDAEAVVTLNELMDGNGAKAGLKQIINERRQADLGASGLGRLVVGAPTATSVSLSEDVAGSPFGMKLNAVSTTLTGAVVTGPAGAPPSLSVDLGATNPNAGEKLQLTFNMPDGTTSSLTLTATTSTTPAAGEFTIGANTAATATNLQAALSTAVGKLANTELVAASAFAASDNFFNASPPLRVSGAPFNTATSLVAGTSANSVQWYTGETGSDPARGTAVARVDQGITVSYGIRANEQGIRSTLRNMATFAAVTTSTTDPNGTAQVAALNHRVAVNLSQETGVQTIQNIEADLAGTQVAMNSAKERHTQTKAMLETMLDQIQGVSEEEVGSKILALQTSLQASYQTTAMLYQTSLVKYL